MVVGYDWAALLTEAPPSCAKVDRQRKNNPITESPLIPHMYAIRQT